MNRPAQPSTPRKPRPSAPSLAVFEGLEPEGEGSLAVYVVPAEEGRFVGYAKLCANKPRSPWNTPRARFKVGTGLCSTPEEAADAARSLARIRLAMHNAGPEADLDSEFIEL